MKKPIPLPAIPDKSFSIAFRLGASTVRWSSRFHLFLTTLFEKMPSDIPGSYILCKILVPITLDVICEQCSLVPHGVSGRSLPRQQVRHWILLPRRRAQTETGLCRFLACYALSSSLSSSSSSLMIMKLLLLMMMIMWSVIIVNDYDDDHHLFIYLFVCLFVCLKSTTEGPDGHRRHHRCLT